MKGRTARTLGFVLGLLGALGAALVLPGPGASGGILHTEVTTLVGVFVIFVIQGVLLPSEEVRQDLAEWRLHLFVQGWIFLGVPLLVLGLDAVLGRHFPPDVRFGFLFLAALPTTITTAVVFATSAGGRQVAAIFNTALSNLLGIIIVPAWTAWLLKSQSGFSVPLAPLFGKLALLILLPIVIGQILRPRLREFAAARKKMLLRVNTGIVLFIVYATAADGVARGAWERQGAAVLAAACGGAAVLLGLVKALVWLTLRLSRFGRAASVTALFCASQKTLATGVPMATTILAAAAAAGGGEAVPEAGVVILPLMAYHVLQLLAGGFIVGWMSEEG